MPNWTYNEIKFSGSEDAISYIIEYITTCEDNGSCRVDFNNIIPMPDYIYQGNLGEEERALYGENNWYDWSCSHWGTKWNASDSYVNGDTVYFSTAWCSPTQIIEAIIDIFFTQEGAESVQYLYVNEDFDEFSGGECYIYYADGTHHEYDERFKEYLEEIGYYDEYEDY